MDQSSICVCTPTYVYYIFVCVCVPCAFLRLQFELKKTVDTRTIGCAAAAAVAAARSSLSVISCLFSSSFQASYSLSRYLASCFSLFFLGSMTMWMRIRTKMHLVRSSSRFASRGPTQPIYRSSSEGHSLFLTLSSLDPTRYVLSKYT